MTSGTVRRQLPTWAVVLLSVVGALVAFWLIWLYFSASDNPAKTSGQKATVAACKAGIQAKIPDATDVEVEPSSVTLTAGSDADGKFTAYGDVDYRRAGEPFRDSWSCEVRRTAEGAAVTSLSVG